MTAVQRRVDALLALDRAAEFGMDRFAERLGTLLSQSLVGLIGDASRDIVRVEVIVPAADADPLFEYRGIAAAGHVRFRAAIWPEGKDVSIALVATKNAVVAEWGAFGKSGPDYGNSLVVARAFDVALEAAFEMAVERFVNSPVNERVRAHYTTMGFERGERLAITSADHLFTACSYIDAVYAQHASFQRPW